MRVLLVNMYYYPNMIGGAEHSVKLLAEGLVKAGHDVAVATIDGKPGDPFSESIEGVTVYRGYCKSIYRRRILRDKSHHSDQILNGLRSLRNPKANVFLKNVIDEFRPDVVHTNNLVTMSYWIWTYCNQKKIALVHTLRDYWLLDPTTRIGTTGRMMAGIFRAVMRAKSNRFSGIVVAPSKSTLELFDSFHYFKQNEKRCIVNSIKLDLDLLNRCISKKTELPDERDSMFLYAGTLNENKGIRQLLSEFRMCEDKHISLVVCGDGDLMQEVKSAAAADPRISVRGKVDSVQMGQAYSEADVLIVPSLWQEPFGRIVIEAAQYGTVVIGSDRGGIPETINRIDFGVCFNPDEAGTLCKWIVYFSDRRNVRTLLQRGPKHLEDYDIKYQIDHYLNVYRTAMSK